MNKKALTLVEIIVSIVIIIILASVGLAFRDNYSEHKFNAKIVADTSSLENSFTSYKQENGVYPEPDGNINFFNKNSSYSHDEVGAFGVHGFITDDMISKKYLNYLPLDPRTNQFYAYGKTLKNDSFELASVIVNDGDYITKINGNYDGQEIVGLIREYNGAQFLYDNASNNFPYNPEENKMTAQIASYKGTVSINGNNTDILARILVPGTIIETSNNSNAQIFYSDGSRSTLEENSKLIINDLEYKEKQKNHNLLTKIKLTLESGTIWTKASRLNKSGSEFEVSTTDTTAAVRGTIFGIQKNAGQTNINLIIGKIDIKDSGGNIIENLEVTAGSPAKQISYKNQAKQAGTTPINFIDKENIFPSNIKLQIESIKENSGKQISIVNAFSKGKLYVGYTPFTCNENGKLLECMVGTIPENTETKFCNNISPENDISCTKEIKLGNLVFNKVNNIIPEDKYQENKTNITANPASPSSTPSPSATYTPCNGSFTPGCSIELDGKKIVLLNYKSGNKNDRCGGDCGGSTKKNRLFGIGPGIPFIGKKYCKKIIDINGNKVKCAKKRIFSRKYKNWSGYEYKILN